MTEYYVLKKSLQTFENYGNTQEFRQQLLQGDTQVLKSLSYSYLKDPKTDPIMMLPTARLSKDCMETFNHVFIGQFQMKIFQYFDFMAMLRIQK